MPCWDIFCRVVDNLGDIGVCWRLAADLADRGVAVRLWADDASALAWMAPDRAQRHTGVQLCPWQQAAETPPEPGAVVIEAFGCDPPPAFVERMRAASPSPRWLNLEYLSAEAVVERNHRLPSPQLSGPGAGLVKTFYYPGFTPATGGLIREPGLLERRSRFDTVAWLATRGWAAAVNERVVSLFCYPNAPVDALIDRLADRPTLLLATAGAASAAVQAALGTSMRRGALRAITLPWLSQPDFDHLLWSSDLNHVRGEDSLVRALWAGRPFVWQIYAQHDGADVPKLDALLQRLSGEQPATHAALRAWWHGWNGWAPLPAALPDPADPAMGWTAATLNWRDALATQRDLASQLITLVNQPDKRAG
jgi:uncharacterized repeat protein (TIGR03837 family)